jgi:magnesium transporter
MTPSPETEIEEPLSIADLKEAWSLLVPADRVESFRALERPDAEDFFLGLSSRDQAELILSIPPTERRSWIRLLAPDDAADLIQEIPSGDRDELMGLLDDPTRAEVSGLLAYAEDDAGGLMSPRYARLRPDMSVDEAIGYLRRAAQRAETLTYAYVLSADNHLLGVISYRELITAKADQKIGDIMRTELVTVPEATDQEELARLFANRRLMAFPVVDSEGRMKGIVTLDDIVDVVREEATEDIQKIGGTAVLDAPYLRLSVFEMLKARAPWLSVLFLGETLTATAMGHFEADIAQAVVLAVFVPLVISSGGNSGSQATTLVIRAMALGEVKLRDWWRVMRREILSGLGLGGILAALGVIRVVGFEWGFGSFGPHYWLIAICLASSLLGVVLWGTIVGSMLPFLLRRLGLDPATASAPFVATLVDVTGLLIYFSAARALLTGTLL